MTAAQMAGWGMWPQAFSGVTKVAAAGTTQATATPFTTADTVIVNGGTGGIVMKGTGTPGDTMQVINGTGAAVLVYPAGSGQISGAGSVSVGANHAVTFKCLRSGIWFNMNDATLAGAIPLADEEIAPPA